ncbi:class I lanthipeptide [Taibaiella chishuiensis]|uniref:Natural product n=1 Tax=Taibaiella chishuiensis TaxID=1434707 RepID=A0A2P8CXC0_9BACT|nr:class I lanthipeptide [Taibaiella chishuiensis]PSK89600.1 hypothetical protein B0I18_111158 [Taibaiella chishuiensis]
MKKKSLNSKLSVHKNTIALLSRDNLQEILGGDLVVKTLIVTCPGVSKPCGSEVDPYTCLSVNCPPTSRMIGCA